MSQRVCVFACRERDPLSALVVFCALQETLLWCTHSHTRRLPPLPHALHSAVDSTPIHTCNASSTHQPLALSLLALSPHGRHACRRHGSYNFEATLSKSKENISESRKKNSKGVRSYACFRATALLAEAGQRYLSPAWERLYKTMCTPAQLNVWTTCARATLLPVVDQLPIWSGSSAERRSLQIPGEPLHTLSIHTPAVDEQ